MLTRGQDYAHQQTLADQAQAASAGDHRRRPEIRTTARGIWNSNVAIRHAERQLAAQAEISYKRVVKDQQAGAPHELWARARHRSTHEVGPRRGKAARQTQSS
jgi:hypothetical protein